MSACNEPANWFPRPLCSASPSLFAFPSFFLLRIHSPIFCSILFLFTCFFKPLVLQALLSRGVTELLLTSDGSDGLKFGGVEGGTVERSRLCTLTLTNTCSTFAAGAATWTFSIFFFLHAPDEKKKMMLLDKRCICCNKSVKTSL